MKKKHKILLIPIKLLIIYPLFNLCSNVCKDRANPILIYSNNSCVLKYCEEIDFENNICKKDNDIIREQWLNNIITFGIKNCRYSKSSKYSNGGFIALTTKYSDSSYSPYFYGLKNNGRPLFIRNNIEDPYLPLNDEINKETYTSKYYGEGEILIVKDKDNGEEYLINVLFYRGEIELFDFQKDNQIYYKILDDKYKPGYNSRGPLFKLKDSNNIFYGGIIYNSKKQQKLLFLLEFNVNKEENEEGEEIISLSVVKGLNEENEIFGETMSCFETDAKFIICFYIESVEEKKYKICLYDENLEKRGEGFTITTSTIYESIFFKCVHYEGESGLFIYYDYIDNGENEVTYPIITFKEKKLEEIKNMDNLNDMQLSSYIFYDRFGLNDFIKIAKDFFCLASVSNEKEILYIVIINIFDEKTKVKLRYYVMRTFGLYNYKFFKDIRLNTFKESIALSFSYCNQTECSSSRFYNSLIIFSYPNTTDVKKNIIDELFEKNQKLEDLVFNFNLSKYIIIENNIFGLVYSKIIIKNIINPNNIKLVSSKTNENIDSNYELLQDDDINALFENYNLFNCTIEYVYEATEPDYTIFEIYPENINTIYGDDENFFEKKTYSGRLSYYNLYLKDKLTKDCSDNCGLCYDDINKKCIVNITNEYITTLESSEVISQKIISDIIESTEKDKDSNIVETTEKENDSIVVDKTEDEKNSNAVEITEKDKDLITEDQTQKNIKDSDSIESTEKEKDSITEEQIEKNKDSNTVESTEKSKDPVTVEPTEKVKDTSKIIDIMDCISDEKITTECNHAIVKEDQFQDLYDQVKNKILNSTTYNREKKVYNMENVILQISKIEDQNDNDNSVIDLGNCEIILKDAYGIDRDESLIIYKSDIRTNNYISTYVQYEVYNPINLEPLNLSLCSKEPINISVSINLNNNTKSLYDSLSKSGHNLFDLNDSFYKDICVTYTTENGTDMSLSERYLAVEDYGGGLNFCQEDCSLLYFNSTNQKAKCECKIKETKSLSPFQEMISSNIFMNKIFGGFQYSNYLVLKCYKLLFESDLFKKNIGCMFMTFILASLIILLFIYIFKGRQRLEYYIQAILENKSLYINNRKRMKRKRSGKKYSKKTKKKKIKNAPPIKKLKKLISGKKENKDKKENLPSKDFSKSKESLNMNDPKNISINIIPINNLNYSKTKNENNLFKNEINKKIKKDINIYKLKGLNTSKKHLQLNKKITNKILDINYINYKTLNIQELNTLPYKIALLIDKRTFFQYYWSLIRKNQLIIFVFVPIDDYNLVSLKISLFLLSFSSYMCVNAFFFDDYTMHQINLISSEKIVLYHIPLIIYSSLISSFIRTILKRIALSENNLLNLKKIRKISSSYKKSNEIRNYLKLKFIIFFIISFLLTFFFWYFISCFCAVYTNTQSILIKDSIISFGFSMLYPFGIYLLPSFFRIPALRDKNKDKLCLYKVSQILALI